MHPNYKQTTSRSERGVALFIAIFTLLLITAIAAGMIMMTNTDTNISSNFRDEQNAFFGAKGGLEEVRDRLRTNAKDSLGNNISLSSYLPGFSTPSAAPPLPGQVSGPISGILYVTNPLNGETVTPWAIGGSASVYPDTEICTEMAAINYGSAACSTGTPPNKPLPGPSGWYSSFSASSTYGFSPVLAWKWVRINVKTNQTSSVTTTGTGVDGVNTHHNQLVCWNGTTEFTIDSTYPSCARTGAAQVPAANYSQVYVLTSLAVTPSGSRRMVQMDVAPGVIPNIPGAMVMDGDLPSFTPGSSNAFFACGADQVSCHSSQLFPPTNGTVCPPHGDEPAIGAYDNASMATINGSFAGPPDRSGNYSGSPLSVSNVNTPLSAGGLNTVQGLNALVNMVTSGALPSNIYNGNVGALANPGTTHDPVINVVTGDLTMTNLTGSGILLVEGNASFGGRPNYDGVILIVGKGNISIAGGGNGVIDGAMLVANLYDGSGHPLTSGAPGTPVMNFSGLGNMTIQYDSCWVAAMNQSAPYKSLGVREMAY